MKKVVDKWKAAAEADPSGKTIVDVPSWMSRASLDVYVLFSFCDTRSLIFAIKYGKGCVLTQRRPTGN